VSASVPTELAEHDQPARDLHVRLVTWDDIPPLGGQGVYVWGLRDALSQRGIEVSTLAGRGPFAMSYRKVTGKRHLDMSLALNLSLAPLLSGDPGLLHVSGGPGGLQLLRRPPVPVVYTAHHTYRQSHDRGARRAYGLVEARSYRRSTMVAAVSSSTASSVIEMGVPRSRVVVIPPGVRGPVTEAPDERERARVLFVGRLEPEKGPLAAVSVMKAVADLPDASGCLVGTGSLDLAVRRAAQGAGCRIDVRGRISEAELAQEYRRATVLVLPSAYEGLCFVALEAMAAGVAVVAYDVAGLHGTVGGLGLLVPPGDTCGLARTTRLLLTDHRRRQELTASAREAVRRNHSWESCARAFDDLYCDVLGAA
jgi:glycosyltransferase involved in cell wall biosynthesis